MITSVASRGSFSGLTGQTTAVDDRPLAQRVLAADDLRGHAQDRAALHARERTDADGLGRVEQLNLAVVHGRRRGRHVLGADRDLVRVHLAEIVVEARDVGDVLLGRLPVLAVSASMTRMPSLKLVKATRPGSMTKSCLGSRPQSVHRLGLEAIASSTMCGGIRPTRVSRSTRQPPSLKMSSASSSSTKHRRARGPRAWRDGCRRAPTR